METTFARVHRWRPAPGLARSRDVILAVALLAGFPALFVLLRAFPAIDLTFGSGSSHFVVVSLVAALAAVLALAVLVAAQHVPDGRTTLLALGFVAMATIFLAHGLGTSPLFDQRSTSGAHAGHAVTAPVTYGGVEEVAAPVGPPPGLETRIARLKVVGYSAQLSLLVSAVFFALATLDLPERVSRFIVRRRLALAAVVGLALTAHLAVALWWPKTMSPLPLATNPVRLIVAGLAMSALFFAGERFLQAHRLAYLPLQGAMAAGMGLLIEAQVFMLEGELWHVSWWLYHFAMLAGFLLAAGSLYWQYRVTGDLGAIVEGLFLRRQVAGIRSRDPRAMHALGAAIAAKDTETAGHIERVGELTVMVGARMGIARDRMEPLRLAGRLHDIGKLGVPNSILRKPGALTPEEFEVVKRHTVRGWHLAVRSEALAGVAPIIRAHHERMDGRGYPDGLKGDEIPLEARIVAVSDVWDALTCDRPYRKAMAWQAAAAIMAKDAGPHLDPDCVEALFEVLGLPDLARLSDQRNDATELRRAA